MDIKGPGTKVLPLTKPFYSHVWPDKTEVIFESKTDSVVEVSGHNLDVREERVVEVGTASKVMTSRLTELKWPEPSILIHGNEVSPWGGKTLSDADLAQLFYHFGRAKVCVSFSHDRANSVTLSIKERYLEPVE